MIEFLYRAHLLPLNERVNVPTMPDRTPWHYTFTRDTFALEQKSNRKIPVCLDHDRLKVVGHVEKLTAAGDWWQCTFKLDPGTRSELKVGAPVSIALQTLGIGSGIPFITEISLVEVGAIKGAEIVSRYPLPSPQARKPEPVTAAPAPPATARPKPKPPPVLAPRSRGTVDHRALEDELRRRCDWLEQQGRDADVELAHANLKRELYGPSLDDLAREYGVSGGGVGQGGPLIRRNVGQVLGVR